MLPASDLRHLAKPWSDFVSCEDERQGGACADGNAQVEAGCACTCGKCVADPFIKPEIPLGKDAIEDWGDEYTGQQSGSAMGGGRRLSRRKKSRIKGETVKRGRKTSITRNYKKVHRRISDRRRR